MRKKQAGLGPFWSLGGCCDVLSEWGVRQLLGIHRQSLQRPFLQGDCEEYKNLACKLPATPANPDERIPANNFQKSPAIPVPSSIHSSIRLLPPSLPPFLHIAAPTAPSTVSLPLASPSHAPRFHPFPIKPRLPLALGDATPPSSSSIKVSPRRSAAVKPKAKLEPQTGYLRRHVWGCAVFLASPSALISHSSPAVNRSPPTSAAAASKACRKHITLKYINYIYIWRAHCI